MDLLAGLNRDLDYAERLKDGLTVGLFGSFKRSHLEALRHHLREREDFRLAEALIEESRVYIVHFFREEEGEYGINDSATLEIGILYGLSAAFPQVSRYTLILCEEGYDARNIGGMRRGIRPSTERVWRWHDFDNRDEAILNATQVSATIACWTTPVRPE